MPMRSAHHLRFLSLIASCCVGNGWQKLPSQPGGGVRTGWVPGPSSWSWTGAVPSAGDFWTAGLPTDAAGLPAEPLAGSPPADLPSHWHPPGPHSAHGACSAAASFLACSAPPPPAPPAGAWPPLAVAPPVGFAG